MSKTNPKISRMSLGPLQTNCYLVVCPETHEALVIDPADEPERILSEAGRQKARVGQILLTHAHPDHLAGLPSLRIATGARVLAHRLEAEMLQQLGRSYGLRPELLPSFLPDEQLEGGEQLTVGSLTATILHTPGHTPGGITVVLAENLFTGDTLFAGNVGRFDLPGGDMNALLDSVRQLLTFPDETHVHPGHGPTSTIGSEKRYNPFAR